MNKRYIYYTTIKQLNDYEYGCVWRWDGTQMEISQMRSGRVIWTLSVCDPSDFELCDKMTRQEVKRLNPELLK